MDSRRTIRAANRAVELLCEQVEQRASAEDEQAGVALAGLDGELRFARFNECGDMAGSVALDPRISLVDDPGGEGQVVAVREMRGDQRLDRGLAEQRNVAQ